jgi:hypothetical protein
VRISTSEQGAAVANAIADLLEAVNVEPIAVEEVSVTQVGDGEAQTLAARVLG